MFSPNRKPDPREREETDIGLTARARSSEMEQLLMRLQSMIERLRLRHILNDDESKEGHSFITVIRALLTTEKIFL